jgi:DNA-binding response OmpR family regulator
MRALYHHGINARNPDFSPKSQTQSTLRKDKAGLLEKFSCVILEEIRKSMRILVVEDHPQIAESLKSGLEAASYAVDIESDGGKVSYRARTTSYDLILLDNILPGKEGKEICRELREYKMTVPIMILSVQSEIDNKVDLLNCGADDYLTKPFSFKELSARVNALLRRPQAIEIEKIEAGDLVLSRENYIVTRNGKAIYLTTKEFSLLEYLMKNQGKVLSRGMITEHVWNDDGDLFSNAIETHIANIRKKIDHGHKQKLIHTLPGRGYMLSVKK